jgi:hypothetical protein
VADIQATGIKPLQDTRADQAVVVQILALTAVVCDALVEQEQQDKDSQVGRVFVTTTTAKIHTMVAEVEAQADLAFAHRIQIKNKQHTAAQVPQAIF